MNNLKKAFDIFVNFLTIAVALLVIWVFINHSSSQITKAENQKLSIGSLLSTERTGLEQYPATVFFALRSGCHWCEDSASFYRELIPVASAAHIHLVAVTPDSIPEARQFLHSLGMDFSDVREVDFKEFGVSGTPTLVLVDSKGRIQYSWLGKLSPEGEDQVFARLGLTRDSNVQSRSHNAQPESEADRGLITGSQFNRALADARVNGNLIPVIDIRTRDNYAKWHLEGALNIPLDELEARASHEVPANTTVIVSCYEESSCASPGELEANGTTTYCSLGATLLHTLTSSDVKLLDEGLPALKAAGVKVSTSGVVPAKR